ncbi:uncharacterized protein LOC141717946 [Apium graveolens]|uniref:uncharacterized protein LOC141717946 n=1 Tax=Apium graveolens TaxID=4045 RepID=UPI003D798784
MVRNQGKEGFINNISISHINISIRGIIMRQRRVVIHLMVGAGLGNLLGGLGGAVNQWIPGMKHMIILILNQCMITFWRSLAYQELGILESFSKMMEHIKPEQIEQTVKGENFQNAAEKSGDLKSDILSRTPAKANETFT